LSYLADSQTNKQTKTGKEITFLVEVIIYHSPPLSNLRQVPCGVSQKIIPTETKVIRQKATSLWQLHVLAEIWSPDVAYSRWWATPSNTMDLTSVPAKWHRNLSKSL